MSVLFSPKDGRIYTGKLPLFLDGNLAQPYFTFEVWCLARCCTQHSLAHSSHLQDSKLPAAAFTPVKPVCARLFRVRTFLHALLI